MSDQPATRVFTLHMPDGAVLHGAQFPSGRCVVDDTQNGLVEGAVTYDDLQTAKAAVCVDWESDR